MDMTYDAGLKNQIQSLEQENAKLKETADFYFQKGVDLQLSGDISGATTAFNTVISKFPTSKLASISSGRVSEINAAAVAKQAAEFAEAQRQKDEQARLEVLTGEYISYSAFYAKALSSGLPTSKRYRFHAVVFNPLMLCETGENNLGSQGMHVKPAFDDPSEYEHFLRYTSSHSEENVVASMEADGRVYIHRLHW
jgi:hypothetical protein